MYMKLSYLLPEKYAVLKKGKISMNLRPVLYCTYKLKNNDNNNNNNNKLKKKKENSIRIWVSYLKTKLSAKISSLQWYMDQIRR